MSRLLLLAAILAATTASAQVQVVARWDRVDTVAQYEVLECRGSCASYRVAATASCTTAACAQQFSTTEIEVLPPPPPSNPNLLQNPSFEAAPCTNYWTGYASTLSPCTQGAFTVSTDARTGTKSVTITNPVLPAGSYSARWGSHASQVSATAGVTYRAAAWVKTSGITNGEAAVVMNFWNGGTHLATHASLGLTGTQPWTRLAIDRTAPASTTNVRLEVRRTGSGGTVWIDDVELSRVDAGGGGGTASPPSDPFAWYVVAAVRGDGTRTFLNRIRANLTVPGKYRAPQAPQIIVSGAT